MNHAELEAELQNIEPSLLTGLVRTVLSRNAAHLVDWRYTRIARGAGSATGGVYRFKGTASDSGELLDWALTLKVTAPVNPLGLSSSHELYWKREVLAYSSGMLNHLPGGITAPRCFAVDDRGDTAWLWLEHLEDGYPWQWPLEQYAHAARALGRFNGAYLAGFPLPSYPWLIQDGSQRGRLSSMGNVRDVIADPHTWQHFLLRAAFPVPVADRFLQLWDDRDVLFAAMRRLPYTFCHMDAWRGNIFSPPGTSVSSPIVMVDWAFLGKAVVATDPSDLLGSFILFGADPNQPADMDTVIFENYMLGLEDAGWQGDRRVVRFAYCACTALKYACVPAWLPDALDDSRYGFWEEISGHSMRDFIRQQVAFTYYLLDLADEARGLLASL